MITSFEVRDAWRCGHKYKYLYELWNSIKQRCYNPNRSKYKSYGAIGIKMHDEWINHPYVFIAWILNNLGDRPVGYTLDRIRVKESYKPGNLRWASSTEQAHNRADHYTIKYQNKLMNLPDFCELYSTQTGVQYSTVRARLYNGWRPE